MSLLKANDQDLKKKTLDEVNLIIKTKSFQKILQIFQTILEKKSLIPIFSNLKISISKNKLSLTGMNIDLAAINEIEILNLLYDPEEKQEIENQEKILLLNGHLFYDVIKKISSEEIKINKKHENNFIEINANDFFCKLSLQENEKFPTIDILENSLEYIVNANVLFDSIESVLSCAAVHDSRAFLCAIKIVQNEDNSVEFIATDGHRMAHLRSNEKQFEIKNTQITENQAQNYDLSLILPRKTAVFILKFLKENQNRKISFRLSNQKIIFLFDDPNDEFLKIKIISKISEGNYPNYKKLLNYNYKFKFSASLKKLLESLDRAMIFLDEKNSKVLNFELQIAEKKIILTAQSDDKGMIKDKIDGIQMINLEDHNKKSLIININAYYLYEILKSIKSDEVFFGLNDEKSPIALSDKAFEEKFYLLMPMIG